MKKIKYISWSLLAPGLYFYFNSFKNAIIDDAFITFRYVKTILNSGTWGFYPGHINNMESSPLNALLLTLISFFTGSPIDAAILLTTACFIIIFIYLTLISSRLLKTTIYGYLAAFALLFNPLLLSTIGLECILFVTLFIVSIYYYLMKRWYVLSILLGLLTITRADSLLILLVFLLFIPEDKWRIRVLVSYLLSIAPWYIFSWIYLGSFIPDTFFMKLLQHSWHNHTFFNGIPFYFHHYPLEIILSFAFLPLIVLFFNKGIRKLTILPIAGSVGLLHFIGYSIAGVPPYHWYYAPEVTTIIIFGSLGLGVVCQDHYLHAWQKTVLRGLVCFYFFVPSLGIFYLLARDHFPPQEAPIHSNWANAVQYKDIALRLNDQMKGKTISFNGEIGTLGYYSDDYLMDNFSNRRGWVKEIIRKYTVNFGIIGVLLKINFHFFTDPPKFQPSCCHLTGYQYMNTTDAYILKWNISSKWIKQGSVILQ